jgi:hypothetical protein
MLDRASDLNRTFGMAGHAARIGKKRNAYRIMVGEPAGKESLERPTDR